MTNIIDRATKQFRDKIAASEILQVEVPQWPDEQGKPTVIYFRPLTALHLETFNKIMDCIRKENVLSAVDILILRALNADLTPMFKPINRIELIKNVDPQVLLEIIANMGELDKSAEDKLAPDIEDIEKKLIADAELFFMYQLADRLKKTVGEILQMSVSEFYGWWAYFNLIKPKE